MSEGYVKRAYTLETRIANCEMGYFEDFKEDYGALCRRIWQDLKHGVVDPNDPKEVSSYVSHLCKRYGYLKRTINAAFHQMKGRAKALSELVNLQIKEKQIKIGVLEEKIKKISEEIKNKKIYVEKFPNDQRMVQSLRDKEVKKFSWVRRVQRYKSQIVSYEKDPKKVYSMCFGTKEFYRKQYHLEENGYKTHEKWLNDFRKRRDHQIYYLGSSDETSGNQMCQLFYISEIDKFSLKVRKENKYCSVDAKQGSMENYEWFLIDFKYRKDLLIKMLEEGKSLSYQIIKKGNKWYVEVSFMLDCQLYTDMKKGCIGLDYNNGFISLTETDRYGNVVNAEKIYLDKHGGGNKAKSELSEKLSKIIREARKKDKGIAIEKLKFVKKKAQQVKKGNKQYNKMLHLLDTKRYTQLCKDLSASYGVMLKEVNPVYTSKIGEQKYVKQKKLNKHNAAAYVIARRAQGFKDELKKAS